MRRPIAASSGAGGGPLPAARMRTLLATTAAVLTMLLASASTSASASNVAAATIRPRASLLEVESQVMCPSCHEPLEAVSSPQALYEKAYIETLIARGLTEQQILGNLKAQYGVAVLAKPPATGFNLTIYILPPLVLAAGAVFLLLTLPKWRERSRAAAAKAPLQPAPALSDADTQRINDDLARLI